MIDSLTTGDAYFLEDGTPEPEPCDGCDLGLLHIFSHDFRRLCRNCVYRWAEAMGWNELPALPAVEETVAVNDNTGANERSEDSEAIQDPEPPTTPGQNSLF